MTEREIFLEALEITTPESRAAYLQAACGGDFVLRRKVDELLKEHFSNDSLLAGSALEGGRTAEAGSPASEAPAQMIGRYKLLEKIVFPTNQPRLDIVQAGTNSIPQGASNPVSITLPPNADTNQLVIVRASGFNTNVPIRRGYA